MGKKSENEAFARNLHGFPESSKGWPAMVLRQDFRLVLEVFGPPTADWEADGKGNARTDSKGRNISVLFWTFRRIDGASDFLVYLKSATHDRRRLRTVGFQVHAKNDLAPFFDWLTAQLQSVGQGDRLPQFVAAPNWMICTDGDTTER